MMKNKIIFLYLIYAISIYLLSIIDIVILMYYIFWIINIFLTPLFWFIIKIIYFNRCILLLLLFYYLIAKYTINILGYKYFLFFNVDIQEWRRIYLDYIFSITTYHIEIFSIFIFFFVIILPLFLYNKDLFFLLIILIGFLFSLFFIMKKRIEYIKSEKKNFNLLNFFFFGFFSLIIIKLFTYYNFKEFITMYIHFDKWTFELLEWKTRMYDKVTEKDLYIRTIGLKPVWVGQKFNIDYYAEKRGWEQLIQNKKSWILYLKQNKYAFIKKCQAIDFKHEFKKECYNFYLFFKDYKSKDYYHKYNIKLIQHKLIIDKLNKNEFNIFKFSEKKHLIKKKKENLLKIKLVSPILNLKNENPVVTMEKERERLLHRTIFKTKEISKLSFDNYYNLNWALKDLTLKHLYYQPFIDKKSMEKYKQKLNEKKFRSLIKMKHPVSKNEIAFIKNIIKQYKLFMQKNKKEIIELKKNPVEKKVTYKYYFLKILDYFILKTGKEKIKKKKIDFEDFLIQIKTNIQFKQKLNKLFFFVSKKMVFNKDNIKVKKKGIINISTYINKEKLEKIDNKVLFNTVEKYNKEGKIKKKDWLKEFNRAIILEKKKDEPRRIDDGPDLSRRNRK